MNFSAYLSEVFWWSPKIKTSHYITYNFKTYKQLELMFHDGE